jgi:hypothetical protein
VPPLLLGAVYAVNSTSDEASCFRVRNPDMSNWTMVNIIDVSIVFGNYGLAQGSTVYDPAADLDGNGTVDIVDAGIVGGCFRRARLLLVHVMVKASVCVFYFLEYAPVEFRGCGLRNLAGRDLVRFAECMWDAVNDSGEEC